jgi:hypothetical protein
VYGLIGANLYSHFDVERLTYSIGEATYRIVYNESELICSESHCVYSVNAKNFKKVYELTTNDKLKLSDGEVEIQSIQILKPQPVIGVFLSNGGCYFANRILSHSQNVLPNFVTKDVMSLSVGQKSKTFMAMNGASKSESSCVVEGSLISTPYGKIAVENIFVGDLVCGLDGNLNKKDYKVIQKFTRSNSIIHELVFKNFSLKCSESHCVFSFTQYSFVNAWALQKGEYILCENGIEELLDVKKTRNEIVHSLKFENLGNYFSEMVLGHSENSIPEDFRNNSLNNSVFMALAGAVSKSIISNSLSLPFPS